MSREGEKPWSRMQRPRGAQAVRRRMPRCCWQSRGRACVGSDMTRRW